MSPCHLCDWNRGFFKRHQPKNDTSETEATKMLQFALPAGKGRTYEQTHFRQTAKPPMASSRGSPASFFSLVMTQAAYTGTKKKSASCGFVVRQLLWSRNW